MYPGVNLEEAIETEIRQASVLQCEESSRVGQMVSNSITVLPFIELRARRWLQCG